MNNRNIFEYKKDLKYFKNIGEILKKWPFVQISFPIVSQYLDFRIYRHFIIIDLFLNCMLFKRDIIIIRFKWTIFKGPNKCGQNMNNCSKDDNSSYGWNISLKTSLNNEADRAWNHHILCK